MQNLLMRTPAVFGTWSQPPGGAATYVGYPSSSYFLFRTSSGYTGKRPSKPLPPHNYSMHVGNCRMAHTYDHTEVSTGQRGWGSGPCLVNSTSNGIYFPPEDGVLNDNLYNEALAKLSDKVRGDLDISVDLAEAGKTAKMLRVTERVIDYTKVFRRKYGLLKSASNAWLEYTYGVKPLLGTIYGLADENLRVVINKTARYSARASGKYEPERVTVNTIFGMFENPVASSNLKRSVTIGVDMYADQHDPARFSSLNPISIAWELTPYSFVVDWFFNLGGYLRNMETYLLYSSKFRSGYRTWLTVGDIRWDWGRPVQPGYIVHTDRLYGDAYVMSLDRTVLTQYPAPRWPSFTARLGSSRLLSAASLLGTLLRGR